jgi:hypothetical protein
VSEQSFTVTAEPEVLREIISKLNDIPGIEVSEPMSGDGGGSFNAPLNLEGLHPVLEFVLLVCKTGTAVAVLAQTLQRFKQPTTTVSDPDTGKSIPVEKIQAK